MGATSGADTANPSWVQIKCKSKETKKTKRCKKLWDEGCSWVVFKW
jgi:hypothetical protein